MDDLRVGATLRRLRLRAGLRQSDVAARARVSQSTVSSIEAGRLDRVAVETLRRVFASVGARLDLEPRWRGAGLDRLLDERHAALVEASVRSLVELGWEASVEVSHAVFGERGSIDVMGGWPAARVALVEEVKTDLVRVDDTVRKLDEKARLVAQQIGEERFGWRPQMVGRILILPDTDRCREQVRSHEATMTAAFPARGDAVRRWLRNPVGPMAGILFVANIDRGGATAGRVGIQRVRVRRRRREVERTS